MHSRPYVCLGRDYAYGFREREAMASIYDVW